MKKILFLGLFACLFLATPTAKAFNDTIDPEKPKLVVGIVVDQMRYDYLTRFAERYGNGGFMRMINEGFNCKNNHFNYIPTYTAPGHTSVYTGTTPAVHGIIGNDWYDKDSKQSVYCAGDDSVASVGTSDVAGKMSPHRMKVSTITDQLKLATQMRGKVIGISIKDRGAILPAGHAANAAFWFHGKNEGSWITSTYYMNELPKWVKDFNKSKAAEKYKTTWETLYPIGTYLESGSDKNDFEGKFTGEEAAVFPHELKKLWDQNGEFDLIKSTPYGNSLTADFAIAALDGEHLGDDNITDFLAVSFSSTDYVGHKFGVNSKEVEDTYLRLDKDLERLFEALDKKVGKGQYTVFLTADHGAVHVPAYLESVKIPAGYFDGEAFKDRFQKFLKKRFDNDKLVENMSNFQIFLDMKEVKETKEDLDDIEEAIANEILTYPGVAEAYTATDIRTHDYTQGMPYLLQKGYNHKRSGNVLFVLEPGVISYQRTGSTHGSGYNYDTQAPLLFYGKGIHKGATTERTEITDIAPTIAALLGVAFPNGATGKPVSKAID